MSSPRPALRSRWAWFVAGAAFVAYPALRPYADAHPASSLDPLAAMASDRWLLAHLLGMLGFALLPVAFASLGQGGPHRLATTFAYVGTVGVLPYYGGEAFGLHAIGARAVVTGDPGLTSVVDGFRNGPVALTLFGLGLVAFAAAGVTAWVAGPGSALGSRLALVLLASGLVLYLPQFFAGPPVRVAHGVLMAAGCWSVGRLGTQGSRTSLPRT